MRGHADLRRAVTAAALCALLALVLPFEALRLVFAAPLALFLPGYAITAVAFARQPLDRSRLLLLSVGLSLAVLALGALVLNYVPGGIRSGSWALLLIAVVAGACRAAALARPAKLPAPSAAPRLSLSRAEGGLIAAGALAGIAAIVLVFVPLSAKDAIGYSEMWIEPFGDRAAGGVQIGVGNRMHEQGSYRLVVRFGGEDRERVESKLTLEAGEEVVVRVPAAAPPPGARPLPVAATLFRARSPNRPYRRVSTWIGAGEETG